MIAITHPGKLGDLLYSIPAAKWLCEQHGSQADFYTSTYGIRAKELLERQSYINKVFLSENYVQTGSAPGIQPWEVPVNDGYTHTYHLGFKSYPDGPLKEHICNSVGAPTDLPIHYEFDHGFEFDGDYIVVAPRGQSSFSELFTDIIRHSPFPVIQIGAPGDAMPGGIDCTDKNMLESLPILAKCRAFIGLMSSNLVLANAFPCLKIAVHDGIHWDMRHVVRSPTNLYHVPSNAGDVIQLISYVNTYSKTLCANDYASLSAEVPFIEQISSRLGWNDNHTHRRWEYGMCLQAIKRHGGQRVIDVGGGGSTLGFALAELGYQVTVNDVQNFAAWIVEKSSLINKHIGFQYGTLGEISNTYDVVSCISVLEHIDDYELAWAKLLSIVEPNGLLFTTVDYHESGSPIVGGHLRTFNERMIRRMIDMSKQYGFSLYGGWPDYRDGGSDVNGHTFASIALRRDR